MKIVLWFFFCMAMLSCGSMLAVEVVEEGSLEYHPTLWLTLWVTTWIGIVGCGLTCLGILQQKRKAEKIIRRLEESDWSLGRHTGVR